tara:strand:- start:265 stop:660 length:396 start_codon:yes stop_codon:yes gene_type:complete
MILKIALNYCYFASSMGPVSSPDRQLKNLRKWRGRKDRDISIASSIIELERNLKKSNRQLSQIADIWKSEVPCHIYENTHPISLQKGVLEIAVNGSSIAYQLQRLIRNGLLDSLQTKVTKPLRKIKVTLMN